MAALDEEAPGANAIEIAGDQLRLLGARDEAVGKLEVEQVVALHDVDEFHVMLPDLGWSARPARRAPLHSARNLPASPARASARMRPTFESGRQLLRMLASGEESPSSAGQ